MDDNQSNIIDQSWVAEYSIDQDCFHVDTLENAVAVNRRAMVTGRTGNYLPFELCETHDKAVEACLAARDIVERLRHKPTTPKPPAKAQRCAQPRFRT